MLRVIRSKAWWALCLPIGSICKTPSPTVLSQSLTYLSFDLSSLRTGLHPPIHFQKQPYKHYSLRHRVLFYHLRTGRVPCLQLHDLRTPHLLHRCRTFDHQPPEGSKDVRLQRHLHLLDAGSYQPFQLGVCVPQVLTRTVLLKAAGSGLQASAKMTKTGQKVLLVGLILQAISYCIFCVILVKSHISIRSDGGSLSHKSSIVLTYALYFSSAFILVSLSPSWL